MTDHQFIFLRDQLADLKRLTEGGFADMNGRVRENEKDIAVLQDRSDRSERQSGIIGAITGAVSSSAVIALKAWFQR